MVSTPIALVDRVSVWSLLYVRLSSLLYRAESVIHDTLVVGPL